MMDHLEQILLLLTLAIAVVVTFQRLHVPTSLGYLLVGVILGPYTLGPTVSIPEFQTLAEFGVVFLLFTIGLNFSLPQLQALRHQVFGLGTGQVVFTTFLVGIIVWLAGLPIAAAFVFGAVFAQSSTTIIASILNERGEENTQHGRLGLAMSVFQDVTAVPFLVIIPVLGISVAAGVLAGTLGWALAKAALAFALVFMAGRWLLRPLFHLVSERRSLEMFTLAVLLIDLALRDLNGAPGVAELIAFSPSTRIIAMGHQPSDDEGIAVLRAGARGYCNVHIDPRLLAKAVETVQLGEVWIGRRLIDRLVAMVGSAAATRADADCGVDLDALTAREQEIALQVGGGCSNKVIAQRLGITERTVKAHLGSVFGKLGVKDRLQLALLVLSGANFLLLDEPTTHLDPPHQMAMARLARRLSSTHTVVTVMHDLSLALAADRLVLLVAVLRAGSKGMRVDAKAWLPDFAPKKFRSGAAAAEARAAASARGADAGA